MDNLTLNSSVMTNERDVMLFYVSICVAIVAFWIAVINAACITVLIKSPGLRKSQFHFLSLCLSIGDFATMFLVVVLLTNVVLETFGLNLPYLCSITSSQVYCSVLFSMFQTLSICIERYCATSAQNANIRILSKYLVKKKLMAIIYVLCVVYTMAILFGSGLTIEKGCIGNKYSFSYMYLKEFPIFLLFIYITVLYVIIIFRLRKIMNTLHFVTQDVPISESRHSHRIKRLKLNILTLGLIIIVLSVAVLPRIIIAISGPTKSGNYGNIMLMIPPLLNPIIYILRFVEFRDMIKPKCCHNVATRTNIEMLN